MPKLLDLFCGAGGCSAGYHLAGFQVTGVDIAHQPHYPFKFIRGDALEILRDQRFLSRFDAIHASPPCQSETSLKSPYPDKHYANILGPVLDLLSYGTASWVVENVLSTKQMPGSVIVCGSSLGLGVRCSDGVYRTLRRHRRFLASFPLSVPQCACQGKTLGVYGGSGGSRLGRYKARANEAKSAMGITWMTKQDMNQAIPPAYTLLIGKQLRTHLRGRRSNHGQSQDCSDSEGYRP